MKILVITNLYPPEFLGGYELGCTQMVDALRGLGHEVRVATSVSRPAGPHETGVDRVLELPRIYSREMMELASPELRQYLNNLAAGVNPANLRALATIIDDFQPDVAYVWNILGLGAIGILALLSGSGLQWVWHVMDSIPRQIAGFAGEEGLIGREFDRVFPGRYVMCSSHVWGEIEAGDVDLGDRITLLPNWVFGEPPPVREEFYAGGTLRMMSACGTLCESKGTDIILEVATRLIDHGYANFVFDLYGRLDDDHYRRELVARRLIEHVHLQGLRPHAEMLPLYDDNDLFVFPTWDREPFGFAPLEAAAAGCVPLVSGGCGYAEWMVDDLDCLKAPRDPEHFVQRIVQVMAGEVDLRGIGHRGQAVVRRDFHISGAAQSVEALLGEAAAEAAGPCRTPSGIYDLARYAEGLIQVLIAER